MDRETMIAYAEVNAIINLMDNVYVEKIPKKLRKLIYENKLENYKCNINPNISLNCQNISQKALAILAVLNYNYWSNEDEKKILIKQYKENEKKYQENLNKKYSSNIFSNNKLNENLKTECNQLVEYKKESFFIKILNKIKLFFKLT